MAIKVVAVDDQNTEDLIVGLNRDSLYSLLDGDVSTLPHGIAMLTEKSDIVLLFAETDEELEERFPPTLPPV